MTDNDTYDNDTDRIKLSDTYQVVLRQESGSKRTLYIHAPTRREAKTQAKREHPQATVQSCSPGNPPEGGTILIYKGYADMETNEIDGGNTPD